MIPTYIIYMISSDEEIRKTVNVVF